MSVHVCVCVCTVALSYSGIQITSFLRRLILSSVSRRALPYFATLSNKRHNWNKKKTEYQMFVFLYHFYLKHLILRRILRDSIHYVGLHVNFPLFLSDFHSTWIFPTDCRKILKYKILWKSVRLEQCRYMRTHMTMLNSRFSQFCERALENGECKILHSDLLRSSRTRHDRVTWGIE